MFSDDFLSFARVLNTHGVEYLIVGGYAFGFYAYPRHTKDLDVWINANPENAARVIRAVTEFFGVCPSWLSVTDLEQPGLVVQLGFEPGRIDLLTRPDGVEFAACYANRVHTEIQDVSMPFISKEDLKTSGPLAGLEIWLTCQNLMTQDEPRASTQNASTPKAMRLQHAGL